MDLIIFLESEFELLANVFFSAAYGWFLLILILAISPFLLIYTPSDAESALKLTLILTSALGNLYSGLVGNPKICSLAYVEFLCKTLPGVFFTALHDMQVTKLLPIQMKR